jgi:hypothetical protein
MVRGLKGSLQSVECIVSGSVCPVGGACDEGDQGGAGPDSHRLETITRASRVRPRF